MFTANPFLFLPRTLTNHPSLYSRYSRYSRYSCYYSCYYHY